MLNTKSIDSADRRMYLGSIQKSQIQRWINKRLIWPVLGEPHFQEKRAEETRIRWRLIAGELDGSEKSALDIACNVGMVASEMAGRGAFSLGLDRDASAIAKARKRYADRERLAFLVAKVGPDEIDQLPRCDIVFCLSMFHYWVYEFGEARAWTMVAALADKSTKLFFEPSSVHYKYQRLGLRLPIKTSAPDFIDLDAHSVENWVRLSFSAHLGGRKSVKLLGSVPCLADDKFRLLFLIA